MGHVFVIVRALREELVLDVDAGDAAINEVAHRARDMQRLAKTGTRIGDHGQRDRPCNLRSGLDLFC